MQSVDTHYGYDAQKAILSHIVVFKLGNIINLFIFTLGSRLI